MQKTAVRSEHVSSPTGAIMAGATPRPTWIITQELGMVPKRKGPFFKTEMVDDFLREAYSLNPLIVCTVVTLENGDDTWWPESGHEWLDIYGDRRRRHPRKDRDDALSRTKAVPVDATDEMIAAALAVDLSREDKVGVVRNVWHAMVAAVNATKADSVNQTKGHADE